MYRCVCHTCQESAVFRDLQTAQAEFNDHAGQQHEVVLERDESVTDLQASGEEWTPAEMADPDSETDCGCLDN